MVRAKDSGSNGPGSSPNALTGVTVSCAKSRQLDQLDLWPFRFWISEIRNQDNP